MILLTIQRHSGIPAYRQITGKIVELIEEGILEVGTRRVK